jgi:hypothetical protein
MSSIDLLWHVSKRVSILVDWLIMFAIHLCAWMMALTAAWYWQVTPQSVADACQRFAQSQGVAILSLAGLSGATVLVIWLRVLFYAVRKMTSHFVWSPIKEAVRVQ